MKRTILSLTCALIVPLTFAQTSTTTTETTLIKGGNTTTEMTTTTTEGTVTTFTPGKTIVVNTTTGDPLAYTISETARYVSNVGKEIEASMIKPGGKVHILYERNGDAMIANQIVVED